MILLHSRQIQEMLVKYDFSQDSVLIFLILNGFI